MAPINRPAQEVTLSEVRKTYLYFSGSSWIFFSETGVMAMLPNRGTLYLAMMSMPARRASERKGPTTMAWGFFSRIIFSMPSRASGTGVPGEASRMSISSTLNWRASAPTFTPPAALISSTASFTALRLSLPSITPREVGTPRTMGSAAAAGRAGARVSAARAARQSVRQVGFLPMSASLAMVFGCGGEPRRYRGGPAGR